MRFKLIQKASDTEDIPKGSLLSDKIIPVSEGFAKFFTLMRLFSGWLLCCLMRLGLHKGHSKLRIYRAFFNFGHAGAW